METNQAAENLQVIRTLMERSALYRRTLAPIMIFAGVMGVAGAIMGMALHLHSTRTFCSFWLNVAFLALIGAFLIARRQALKDRESFWSPPTRRVGQALMVPLAAGLIFSTTLLTLDLERGRWLFIFATLLFYGCALHAAGFFMVRGMKFFAWILISLGGATLFTLSVTRSEANPVIDHALMGFFFGVLHLGYGLYLRATERPQPVA